MNLIADTNVWYWISDGRRNPSVLKAGGNRLIAHPISILEIVSEMHEVNYATRRAAAQALLDHSDEIVEDTESHLVRLWGLVPRAFELDWRDIVFAVARSSSLSEITSGVVDPGTRRRLSVNLPAMKSMRDAHWRDFHDTVVSALDTHCPGYKEARQRGARIGIDQQDERAYAQTLRSAEFKRVLAIAVFNRALLAKELPPREPTDSELAVAAPKIRCYLDAYVEYIIRCATDFSPQPNDLGDSECFIYLQGSNSFLSSDKRWVRIARSACPNNVFDPENKVPQ
jgi:hypothetical protein